MKFCRDMYLDNRTKPREFQRNGSKPSKVKVEWVFLCVLCVHNAAATRVQYLALSRAWWYRFVKEMFWFKPSRYANINPMSAADENTRNWKAENDAAFTNFERISEHRLKVHRSLCEGVALIMFNWLVRLKHRTCNRNVWKAGCVLHDRYRAVF